MTEDLIHWGVLVPKSAAEIGSMDDLLAGKLSEATWPYPDRVGGLDESCCIGREGVDARSGKKCLSSTACVSPTRKH